MLVTGLMGQRTNSSGQKSYRYMRFCQITLAMIFDIDIWSIMANLQVVVKRHILTEKIFNKIDRQTQIFILSIRF